MKKRRKEGVEGRWTTACGFVACKEKSICEEWDTKGDGGGAWRTEELVRTRTGVERGHGCCEQEAKQAKWDDASRRTRVSVAKEVTWSGRIVNMQKRLKDRANAANALMGFFSSRRPDDSDEFDAAHERPVVQIIRSRFVRLHHSLAGRPISLCSRPPSPLSVWKGKV